MRRMLWTVLAVVSASGSVAQESQEPKVTVEKIADNVYAYTYNVHRSLFVVTGDGILATDPQSEAAAARFVEEIRKISPAPIRYLVYSHHHADHVSGGAAFGSEPVVIAQQKAYDAIAADPGTIVPPELTFAKDMSVHLGALEVRLVYPGPSETDSNIVVYIPERKVAFMVDAVSVRTVPWRNMRSGNPHAWRAALQKLDELEFEILVPGHGPIGKKSDVALYVRYFEDLTSAVQARIDAGETLEQVQETLELPQYADWMRYDSHFKLNIEGVYRELSKR